MHMYVKACRELNALLHTAVTDCSAPLLLLCVMLVYYNMSQSLLEYHAAVGRVLRLLLLCTY
jgi:hypothetical protein